MEPFKKKDREVDSDSLKNVIKEQLNRRKKPIKFTWEGLKNLSLFFETNPFDKLKVERFKELTEGSKAKEKDYVDFFEDVERGLYGGVQDLGYAVGDLLTSGIDIVADTELTEKLTEAYEQNKVKDTETLLGATTKVLTQYGVPGSAVAKVANRIKVLKKANKKIFTLQILFSLLFYKIA